ncbi:enoyl-CoA hydratase-related protein [Ramlibacter albus]|uniref:Enoyl-CoA hydratase/isomerase family protein n=1 Tax=Ramlibacter albus TaxID=2079448 RepID=A0A923S4M6_9BURK|nr:enoyl-CoA hydratase-related protein [Ramlibacter albus]MBC5767078.1 enoyl-CoA hydratase/isomerase family protein [Ramlibacter albus]
MATEHITTALSEGILTITLNRPEAYNAYTTQMGQEIGGALDRADRDDEVRVVIFTGAGKGFCGGADIATGSVSAGSGMERKGLPPGGIGQRLFESHKPIIAAIHGSAVGVGVTMTLPMDFRICAEGSKFGFVFTRRGLVPEAGSSWFLPRIVGMTKALEWVYAAKTVTAEEAKAAGLVNDVVPADKLLDRAREIAREIAQNTSPIATVVTRQLMWRASAAPDPFGALKVDSALNLELSKGPDVKEGFTAFREKRAPDFPGRPSKDLPALFPWW